MFGNIPSAPDFSWLRKERVNIPPDLSLIVIGNEQIFSVHCIDVSECNCLNGRRLLLLLM